MTAENDNQNRVVLSTRAALNSEDFRVVIRWVLDRTKVFETAATTDASTISFREGQRSVGHELIQLLNLANPRAFSELIAESVREQMKRNGT